MATVCVCVILHHTTVTSTAMYIRYVIYSLYIMLLSCLCAYVASAIILWCAGSMFAGVAFVCVLLCAFIYCVRVWNILVNKEKQKILFIFIRIVPTMFKLLPKHHNCTQSV